MKKLLLFTLIGASLCQGSDLDRPLLEVELAVTSPVTPPTSPVRETEPGQTPERPVLDGQKELSRLAKIQQFIKNHPKIEKIYDILGHNITRSLAELFIAGIIYSGVLQQQFGTTLFDFALNACGFILAKHLGLMELYFPDILKLPELGAKTAIVYGLFQIGKFADNERFYSSLRPFFLGSMFTLMGFEAMKEIFKTRSLLGGLQEKLATKTKQGLTKLGWQFEESKEKKDHEVDLEAGDGRTVETVESKLKAAMQQDEFKSLLKEIITDMQKEEATPAEEAAAAQA